MKVCAPISNSYNKRMIFRRLDLSIDESVLVQKKSWNYSQYFLITSFWWNAEFCKGSTLHSH